MGAAQCCTVCTKEQQQPISTLQETGQRIVPAKEGTGSPVYDTYYSSAKAVDAGVVSSNNEAGIAENAPAVASSSNKDHRKNDTHFQVKRVESKDERDFKHQWDLSSRVVADLQKQFDDAPGVQSDETRRSVTLAAEDCNELQIHSRTAGAEGGFTLNFPITFQEAEALRVHYCKVGGHAASRLNRYVAEELVQSFKEEYTKRHPIAVAEISVPPGGNLVVVGDTHGQLQDVLFIWHTFGPPSANNVYLFNGDIADRGPNACEIFFLIFAYFLADKNCILVNRGNHESPEMNATDADSGGGFRDEVLKKYNSISLYDKFVKSMRAMSLCSVIQKEVFVVHGGLSAQLDAPDLTLDTIRRMRHTSCCCPEPETQQVDERAWIDLIWSDPTPRKGAHQSTRGAGVRFGPDITERFLKKNQPLRMIIRGHELPDGQRGYQKMHGGRVLTVFSASNYCEAANQGAVAIFTSRDFPSYTLHEYYAPSLKQIEALVNANNKEWAREGRLLSESEKAAKEAGWWHKEVSKLMISIVEMKPQIWTKFHEATHGERCVDHDTWIKLLSEVVGTHWHWGMAWKKWDLGDLDNKIDFTNFLQRFSVVLQHDAQAILKYKNIARCFEAILEEHANLSRTLKKFDTEGNGMVTAKGLRSALKSLDLGLTKAQIDSMLHVLFNGTEVNGVHKMPVQEFLGRFTMVYKHAEDALSAGERTDDERLLHDTMSRIAHVIASHSSKEINKSLVSAFEAEETAGHRKKKRHSHEKADDGTTDKEEKKVPVTKRKAGSKNSTGDKGASTASASASANKAGNASTAVALKIEKIFEIMDTDHSGFVTTDHFVTGLWAVPGMQEVKLQNGENLSQDMLRRCAVLLDRSGQISILELLEAFCFEDSHQGDGMADALAEHMLAVLFRYRLAVRAGARYFDPQAKGKVSEDQFNKVLQSVNKQIEDTGVHFTQSQIDDLCSAVAVGDKKGESWIHYEEFFNSFEIVDAQNAALGVAVKSKNSC